MATTSNTITATAGQTEFSFSFPYLKKESIKVTIDTVATTAFTIPDNNPTTVVLNSGATAGQVIVISRLTSTTATPSTFFSGGAIRSQDLNNNFDSILYITQEKENQLTEVIAGGIADGSITSSKLADQSVGTAALIDGGVATVDLADNAVTTAKIVNNAVTTDKIINDAVTTPKIINDAVTTAKIINNAVTTAKILDANVTTAKIADDAVTPTKLDRSYLQSSGGVVTGNTAVNGSLLVNNAAGAVNNINLDGTTGNGTFTGNLYPAGIQYTGYSGVMKQSWNAANGGVIYQIVDNTAFKLCYSAGNNITWSWNTFSQVVATIDGVVAVVCGSGSDYRLKENVELSTYGTDAVKALRPVSYTFKDSGASGIGFIAHEAAEVVPGSATGEKDGEMMQSINTYPIVATLTKALQESIERIETLEAKVQTLENN